MTHRLALAAAPYAVLSAALILAYPEVRGELLIDVYTLAEALGGLVGLALWWRTRRRPPTLTRICAVVLVAASLSGAVAAAVLPGLEGLLLVQRWQAVLVVHCLALGIVLWAQVREVMR